MSDGVVSVQKGNEDPVPWRDFGQKVVCLTAADHRCLFVAFAGDYLAAHHVIDFLLDLMRKKPRLGCFPIFRQRVAACIRYAYEQKFRSATEQRGHPLSLIFTGIDYSRTRGKHVALYETLMCELHTSDFRLIESASLQRPICVAGSGEAALQNHVESFRQLQFGQVTALEFQASIIQQVLKDELDRLGIHTVGRIFHGVIMDSNGVRPLEYRDTLLQQGIRWEPQGRWVKYDTRSGSEQILISPKMVLEELAKDSRAARAL